MNNRRSAIAGESFTYAKRFQKIPGCEGEVIVASKGEGNSGQWVCISCGEPIENQMQKDFHCDRTRRGPSRMVKTIGGAAKHVLAWRSFISGEIEVP